jgi:hypothetical protein
MNQLRNDLRKHQTPGRQDATSSPRVEDIEVMGVALNHARQEMVKLKKMVGDQQEIIQLLLTRLQDNHDVDQTNCPSGKQEALAGGRLILAASRLQTRLDQSNLETDAGQALQCTDENSDKNSELVTAVESNTKHTILPRTNNKRHTVSSIDLGMEGLLSGSDNSCTASPSRTLPLVSRSVERGTNLINDAMNYEVEEFRNRGRPQGSPRRLNGKLRWSADDVVEEGRHDYDDLTFGSNTAADHKSDTVQWQIGDSRRDLGAAVSSLPNDSEDLDLYSNATGGSAAAGRQSGSPRTAETRIISGPEIENRYRPLQTGSQPRPLNIERNDCDSSGSQHRSHDNTTQNVNLNTGLSRKYPEELSSTPRPTYLNNDPLVGHKIIANRNIYQGELQDDGGLVPLAVPQRPVVEVADGGQETRSCPVCNEGFPETVPMGQFQQHVLDCVGPPSPPQEERACPVCNTVYPESFPQAEFEAHVNGHFPEDPLRFEILDP